MEFTIRHCNLSLSFSAAAISGKQSDFTGVAIVTIDCSTNLKTLVWDAVPNQVKIIEVQGKFKVDECLR